MTESNEALFKRYDELKSKLGQRNNMSDDEFIQTARDLDEVKRQIEVNLFKNESCCDNKTVHHRDFKAFVQNGFVILGILITFALVMLGYNLYYTNDVRNSIADVNNRISIIEANNDHSVDFYHAPCPTPYEYAYPEYNEPVENNEPQIDNPQSEDVIPDETDQSIQEPETFTNPMNDYSENNTDDQVGIVDNQGAILGIYGGIIPEDIDCRYDGVFVYNLISGKGAEDYIVPGDIIIAIDGMPVYSVQDVKTIISNKQIGDHALVKCVHAPYTDEPQMYDITLR